MMKRLTTVMLLATVTAPVQAGTIFHLDEVGFDVNSQYVARGAVVAERAAVQPTATLSLTNAPVTVDLWGSFVAQDREVFGEVDELDVTATTGLEVPVGSQKFDLSCGLTRYHFTGAPSGAETSHELGLSCAHQSWLAPQIDYYYDFDLLDAHYLQVCCGPEVGLNRSGSLSLSLAPSVAVGDLGQEFGFQDASMAMSASLAWGSMSLSPTFGYSYGSAEQNPDHHGWWGGFGVRFVNE